ncbi:MAG: hypothetical protein WCO26_14970 [Deltaproteobacteria bacterium]
MSVMIATRDMGVALLGTGKESGGALRRERQNMTWRIGSFSRVGLSSMMGDLPGQ